MEYTSIESLEGLFNPKSASTSKPFTEQDLITRALEGLGTHAPKEVVAIGFAHRASFNNELAIITDLYLTARGSSERKVHSAEYGRLEGMLAYEDRLYDLTSEGKVNECSQRIQAGVDANWPMPKVIYLGGPDGEKRLLVLYVAGQSEHTKGAGTSESGRITPSKPANIMSEIQRSG
ncbi:hypothetical protein HYU13_05770 [Candidatus Woesearchaeota archaeon]|nr:hypothetical protein [Candidatus Woesearchaeota archaeon]